MNRGQWYSGSFQDLSKHVFSLTSFSTHYLTVLCFALRSVLKLHVFGLPAFSVSGNLAVG